MGQQQERILALLENSLGLGVVTPHDIHLAIVSVGRDDELVTSVGPHREAVLICCLGLLPPLVVPVQQGEVVEGLWG